jgi:hypothetical protein
MFLFYQAVVVPGGVRVEIVRTETMLIAQRTKVSLQPPTMLAFNEDLPSKHPHLHDQVR